MSSNTQIEALEKIAENPYPENIFMPLTKGEWTAIKTFLNSRKITLDRLSADIARTVRKPDMDAATKALASYKGGEDLEPVQQTVSMEEYNHAINEIGQLQEQLKEANEYIRDLQRGIDH